MRRKIFESLCKKIPDVIRRGIICKITFSSLIQTLLSVLEFHQISRQSGSRTIPPVGTCTLPRRSYSIYSIHYKSIVLYFQGLCFLFNLYFHIFTSTNPPKKQIFLWVVTFLIYFIIFLFLLSLFHVYKYCNNIIFLSDALISPSKIPLYPFFSYLVQIFSYLVQKFLTFFTHFLCILKVFSDENTFS